MELSLPNVRQISSIKRVDDEIVILIQYGKDTLTLKLQSDNTKTLGHTLKRAVNVYSRTEKR